MEQFLTRLFLFQFHIGTIKRYNPGVGGIGWLINFNSILVRLKEIKQSTGVAQEIKNFNSILVRLKVLHQGCNLEFGSYFNSILVRLKEDRISAYNF